MKGVHIAAFILCFSLSLGMLSGIGWFGHVGVHPDAGLEEQTEQTVDETENVSASDAGSEEFSMIRGTIDALQSLRLLTVGTYGALTNLGVPGPIAFGVQGVVTFTVGIALIQVIRGMRF